MKTTLRSLRFPISSCVIGILIFSLMVFTLGVVPRLSAAAASGLVQLKVHHVKGSAITTITSITPAYPSSTSAFFIQAEQQGHLSKFGKFTGSFAYLAAGGPTGFVIVGNATLTDNHGDKLFLLASILELGSDYPYTITGTLTVTGGTGDYAGASGSIAVSGKDTASLQDSLELEGTLVTIK